MDKTVLGLFTYVDVMLCAAERLKGAGYGVTVFSPIPIGHEIEHSLGEKKNFIKYFAFIGSVIGFCFGVLLTFGTAVLYILPRGGRPIFFFTPTLLISYETAILVGVNLTLMSFFVFARLPSFEKKPYDPAVNVDSFGLLVEDIRDDKYEEVQGILKEFGADEVKLLER